MTELYRAERVPTNEGDVEIGRGKFPVANSNLDISGPTKETNGKREKDKSKPKSWVEGLYGLVHNQSKRDIQATIQSTCAFVFAALAAFKSNVKGDLSPAWLIVVMAPMLLQDNLGGTIVASRGAAVNFTCGAIFIYILQKLGMGYHTYTSSCIVFFIVCFWMGYINPAMGPRKIALLLPAVLIVTIVTTPNYLLTDTFVWNFLASTCMSIAIDLAIALLLIPRYASFELTERFHYGLRRNAEVLELIFNAMLSQHKAESEIYLFEADELIRCMQENQDNIGMRSFLGSYEPVTILRNLFRSKQVVYNRFDLSDFPLMSSTSFWHIMCLSQAVRDIHYNEYHARTWLPSRPAFQRIATKFNAVIKLLGNPTDTWLIQDPVAIDAAIVELKKACDHMYATLSQSLVTAEKEVSPAGNPPGSSLGAPDLSFPIPEANSTNGHAHDTSKDFTNVSRAGSNVSVVSHTRLKLHFDEDATAGANRLSASFFLFHLSELMQSMDNRFSSPVVVTPAASPTLLDQVSAWWAFLCAPFVATGVYTYATVLSYGVDVRAKAITGLRTAMLLGVGLIFCEVPKLVVKFENGQWILLAMMLSQSDNLGGTLYQARNRFLGTLSGAVYSYFVFLAVGDGNTYHIIGMYIPCLLVAGLIKQNKQWSYYGSVWVTTGLLITFGRSVAIPRVQDYLLLRIQENAVGILLAFAFSFLTFPVRATELLKSNVVGVLSKMSSASDKILAAFNKHVHDDRCEQKASHASNVVVDGRVDSYRTDSYTSEEAAQMDNLTHDAVQINSTTSSPEIQYTLDHAELTTLAQHKRVQSLTYILPEAMVISQRMSQQPLLLEQSVMERIFISKPFPDLTYTKLMATQKKVLHMMITIDRALLRISQFSELKLAHSSVLFGKHVSSEVRILLAEVTTNLDKWSKQLQYTQVGIEVSSASTGDVAGITTGSVTPENIGTAESRARSATTADLEAHYHVIASANTAHLETRLQHARGLEKMHKSAVLLAQNCLTFTNMAWRGWSDILLAQVSDDGTIEGDHAYSEANIHHLFDVLTTFNALFYASNQLANATVVLGNIMYTILTLENKSNHKAF